MQSGSRSAVVLRKAMNAIIAAIFLDSQDIHQVLIAVTNLGLVDPGHNISEWIHSNTGRLFGHDDFSVDPRLLSTSQTAAAELFC
jgi:dsRNA-specific ribonuclease